MSDIMHTFTFIVMVNRLVDRIHDDLEGIFQFNITPIHYLQSTHTHTHTHSLVLNETSCISFTIF